MAEAVHIGKAATLAGVSADTIRFYQELGLIKSAGRSAGGYRLFEGEQIRDHICATCPGIGVLSDRSQRTAGVTTKAPRLFRGTIHTQRKVGDVPQKINSLSRLEAELADALRKCNRELRLRREIKHEDCCPPLTKLDRKRLRRPHVMPQVEENLSTNKSGSRSSVIASLAALGSAIAASSCCLPLLPFVFAAGAAGTAAFVAQLRPYLLVLSVLLIAFSFYKSWRAKQCNCKPSRISTLLLWVSAFMVFIFICFPQVIANLVADLLAGKS